MKIRLILGAILGVMPALSYAWMPCMPFCDSGCGGVALQGLGTSVASAMQSQGSANQQLLNAINDVTQTNIDFGTDMADAWTSSTMDILSALDARTSKIELAQTMQIKAREFSTDALNNVFVQALREKYTAEQVSENNKTFSNTAMPETGEIGAIAASELKQAYLKTHQHAEEVSVNQKGYSEELTPGDTSIALNKKLATNTDVFNGHIISCERTLSDDELNNMQVLITYLTNPNPLPVFTEGQLSSPKAQSYELQRRIYNAKTNWVSAIANEMIAHRAQFASPDWVRSYVNRSSTEAEMSMNESLASLIEGRVTSDGWYLNTKIMNETGLERELTYLKSEENALLFMLSQRREWRNQLLSLMAVGQLGRSVEQLKKAAM